jgi:hypothetical protein
MLPLGTRTMFFAARLAAKIARHAQITAVVLADRRLGASSLRKCWDDKALTPSRQDRAFAAAQPRSNNRRRIFRAVFAGSITV